MGDDDVILDGALGKIVNILEKGDYGVVFLNSYGFTNDFIAERPRSCLHGYTVFTNINEFIRKSSYLMTFISVNIVSKEFADEIILYQLVNTNLVHLGWTFSALLKSKKNVFVNEYCIASRMYNSGGYRLCEVFALKFNQVFDFFVERGIDRKKFDIINNKLLAKFFPAHIIRCRTNLLNLYPEDYYRTLYPLYKTYPNFWLFTVPAIFLPLWVCKFILCRGKNRQTVYAISMTTISIIIPTLNAGQCLGQLLASLKNQSLKIDEVIIADSSSDDTTASLARTYGVLCLSLRDMH